MPKSLLNTLFLLFILVMFSCCSNKKENISTFVVKTTNYEDILEISGLVEPVNVLTFTAPQWVDGKIIYLIKDGTQVEAGETLAIIEDKGREENYENNLANLAIMTADLEKTKADLDMQYALLEAQVQNNAAETQITNLDSTNLKFLSPNQQKIRQLEIERSAIVQRQLSNKLKSLSIINQSEIRKMELRIAQYQNRVQSSKDQLDELIVKSTSSGIAMHATNPFRRKKIAEGDPIYDGMPLVIIPQMDQMKVKIQATEGDYKLINVDDSVTYTFDAMPGNRAWGKVLKKSPVGQTLKENSKVKFFEIEASIDKMDVVPKPDLSARCRITLKQIPDTLVIPQVAIFEQDSMNVVYVKKGEKFERRQILTGTTSSKSAVVVAGLKPREEISLSKPGSQLILGEKLLPKEVIKKYANSEQPEAKMN